MKKLFGRILAVTVILAASAFAQAESKIGVVDLRDLIQKSPQMAAINTNLQKQFKPRETKIVEAQKALQAKVDKLNRDGSVMSETERAQVQGKIIADKATLKAMISAFQQELNTAQNKDMQKLLGQINEIVAKIGREGKYSAIMVRDATAYFDKALDITPQVLQSLGKK